MKTIIPLLFLCTTAYAEVTVVPDASPTNTVHQAKVLTKNTITQKMPQIVERVTCENLKERIHYIHDKVVHVFRTDGGIIKSCKKEIVEENLDVVIGYEVTYRFKGKLIYAKLNYDPGDFVQVYAGN